VASWLARVDALVQVHLGISLLVSFFMLLAVLDVGPSVFEVSSHSMSESEPVYL
jgi:hypothetical protein